MLCYLIAWVSGIRRSLCIGSTDTGGGGSSLACGGSDLTLVLNSCASHLGSLQPNPLVSEEIRSEDLRRLYEVLGNPIIPHCALSASGLEYKLRVLSPQASISFSLRRLHTYTQLR